MEWFQVIGRNRAITTRTKLKRQMGIWLFVPKQPNNPGKTERIVERTVMELKKRM